MEENKQPDVIEEVEATPVTDPVDMEEKVESPYKNGFLKGLDNFFGVTKAKSSIKVELFAGIATFLAMCYILVVNPNQILYVNGIGDKMWSSVFIATVFGAVIGTVLMSLMAKMPYAQAPGMGLNAAVGGLIGGVSAGTTDAIMGFGNAMLLVLISGFVFLLLTIIPGGKDKQGKRVSLREYIFDAIPKGIRNAIPVGIGLFIAYIGLQNAGVIVTNGFTQVDLVLFNVYTPQLVNWISGNSVLITSPLVCFIGLFTIAILSRFKVKAAVIIGILVATIAAIPMGVADLAVLTGEAGISWAFWENFANFFSMDPANGGSFLAAFTSGLDFSGSAMQGVGLVFTCIMTVISFCMIDMFDTMGTITGCATRAGLIDEDGKPLNLGKCMYADAIATCAGAALGTSTVTTFVESGAGVAAGGKTGLTALTVAGLFFLSIFVLPFFAFIPSAAAASALVYVGVLMMANVKNIDFINPKNAVSAFLTIVIMPLGYSITDGIGIGLLAYTIISVCEYIGGYIVYAVKKTEKPQWELSPITIVVVMLFLVYFFVPTSFS